MRRSLVLFLALFSPSAAATTYVVDAANGPGTDFTQISTAIAAVAAGDTLLVRSGQYTGFVLEKELAIVGLGTSVFDEANFHSATIRNLPAGSTTLLANLRMNGFGFGGFRVLDNAGAVVIDDLTASDSVEVSSSTDVRFRRLTAGDGVRSTHSRVEIADSQVTGKGGFLCTCCNWPNTSDGQPALNVIGGEVHVARSNVQGGSGGTNVCADTGGCDGDGGDGGPGIVLQSGARLLLAGSPQQSLRGGPGAQTICIGGKFGAEGPALVVGPGSEARTSGVSFFGAVIDQGGTITSPPTDDPTFRALSAPTAGGILTLRVHGPVGAHAEVVLGRRPIVVGTLPLDEEQLAPENRLFDLGPVLENGTASLNYPVSAFWPQGFAVVFQARITLEDETVLYTNSVPAIVQ